MKVTIGGNECDGACCVVGTSEIAMVVLLNLYGETNVVVYVADVLVERLLFKK